LRQAFQKRDPEVLSGEKSVAQVFSEVKAGGEYTVYGDGPLDGAAIVRHPPGETPELGWRQKSESSSAVLI